MTEHLTAEQLEEIKARCEAATPGPWLRHPEEFGQNIFCATSETRIDWLFSIQGSAIVADIRRDIDFMAAARTDVPALVAEVEWLRAHLTQIKAATADLMADSEGVTGLHRNGDIADWEWLVDNGWLPWMEES